MYLKVNKMQIKIYLTTNLTCCLAGYCKLCFWLYTFLYTPVTSIAVLEEDVFSASLSIKAIFACADSSLTPKYLTGGVLLQVNFTGDTS